MQRIVIISIFFISSLFSCSEKPGEKASVSSAIMLDKNNMDTTVSPGNDFFKYANGSWINKNPIPPSQTQWGSFAILRDSNQFKLRKLLIETAEKKDIQQGSIDQKIKDFYLTGMDSNAVDKTGIKPIQYLLDTIANIHDKKQLWQTIGWLHSQGLGVLFNFSVYPDEKDVTTYYSYFSQGGLGLPDRDYYLNTDDRTSKIRNAYQNFLPKVFKVIGKDSAASKSASIAVFDLEKKLATASLTRVEKRDPYKTYNKFSLKDFKNKLNFTDWEILSSRMGITNQDSCIIDAPVFFKKVAEEINRTPLETWKSYLTFHLVNDLSPYLSNSIDTLHFGFYGKILYGQAEQRPRWKRVLSTLDECIGEMIGEKYVQLHFTPDAKKRMLELVNNLQETFASRIEKLDWMSDTTKKKALTKLHTFVNKIGYPDEWKDYSKLTIQPDHYVSNVIRSAAFGYQYSVSKLGKPVNKKEWEMTPQTVNAYYNPVFNEIVFPAGILQYPFFDMNADDAINYGGIGAVIGHEMTHGFDDEGRQYDASGNLKDWWTAEDARKFTEKAAVVETQFNQYTVLDSLHVNGKLTLGENLADLGGLSIAYEAFHKTKQAKENTSVDGLTPDQRFFLSWAQVWRVNTRPQSLAANIITDPHSPGQLRCNGPVSNMDPFYAAFQVKPTEKLFRPDSVRAKIW